jgi:thiamine pyrophosphate-dependent acetolactate synthase large subunit-like protein
MLAIVHANVGLMHATMAFYGAWCDRAPVVVLGANGPHDATKRRPWIDWIHTFRDPAALVRAYTKWDDEPGSARAMLDSITRAYQISMTRPYGPTFVVLDVAIQEERFEAPSLVEGLQRFAPPTQSSLSAADVARVADRLCAAKSPVILLGRGSRDIAAWDARIRLAEALGARVISDSRAGAAFPTRHPLHVGVPFVRLPPEANEIVRRADVILALECIDLNGTLVGAFGTGPIPAYLIACSLDRYVHNGASMDHGAMAPADLQFAADAESFTRDLGAEIDRRRGRSEQNSPPPAVRAPAPHDDRSIINTASLLDTLELQFSGTEVCYIRLPIAAYDSISMPFNHPLDYLGGESGQAPAWRWAPLWRCALPDACRLPCSVTATTSWA